MIKKRNLTQQKICDEAIEMLENGFLKDSFSKKRKIDEESKEDGKKGECLMFDNDLMNMGVEKQNNSFYEYNVIQVKGSGAFGRILSVEKNGIKYAIKQIKQYGNRQSIMALQNEKYIMKNLSHPNIVKYYSDEKGQNNFCGEEFMVLEYIENDLESILRDPTININPSLRKNVMKKLLEAVDYLHNQEILHRDIKPSNILCSRDLDLIKICDFGLSTKMIKDDMNKVNPMNPYVVTLWYRAPELLLNHQNYDGCIDIWSLGLIAIELSQPHPRKPVFCKSTNEKEMIESIINLMGVPSLPDQFPNRLPNYLTNFTEKAECDFIFQMLNLNMNNRINAHHSLNHEWITHSDETTIDITETLDLSLDFLDFMPNDLFTEENSVI